MKTSVLAVLMGLFLILPTRASFAEVSGWVESTPPFDATTCRLSDSRRLVYQKDAPESQFGIVKDFVGSRNVTHVWYAVPVRQNPDGSYQTSLIVETEHSVGRYVVTCR